MSSLASEKSLENRIRMKSYLTKMEKGSGTNKLKYPKGKCKQREEAKHISTKHGKNNQTADFQKRTEKF